MKEKNQSAVENVNKVTNKVTATTEKVAAADKLQAEIEAKTKELQKCPSRQKPTNLVGFLLLVGLMNATD